MNWKSHSHAGFTLWEILGVICLIIVVAAILFPVFQKARGGSRRPCQSNLKQLSLALIQYTQDSDEYYPPGKNTAGNGWAGQLYFYGKSTEIYHCPSDPSEGKFISYAANQNPLGQSIGKFDVPPATVTFYETTTLNCDPSTPEAVSTTGISAPQNSTRHDSTPNSSPSSPPNTFGLNFGFADGHVKFLTPGKVSDGLYAVPTKSMGAYAATFAVK